MILNGIYQVRPNLRQKGLEIRSQSNNEGVYDKETSLYDFLVVVP